MESGHQRLRKNPIRPVEYVELASTPLAPVEIALVNPAANNQPVIYIGDAAQSVLTLTLTNQTNRDITLKAAATVPADMDDPGSAAAVYLDFNNLPGVRDPAGLSVSAGTGWRAIFFPDIKLWGLCPASDLLWPHNSAVSITINKVLVSEDAGGATLDVYYVNFDRPERQFHELKLLVYNPPGNKATANITATMSDPVLITPLHTPAIQNTIDLVLVNGQGEPLKAGPNSLFYVSLVYGIAPGYGALMSVGSATPEITVTQQGGDGWAVHPDTTGKTPFWNLRPTGGVVLGTGAAAIAVFEISGITVPSDFVAGPTTLYVQWANLPRYRDGHVHVVVQKRMPKPAISVEAVQDFVDYGTNPVLTWQTMAVPYLQLSYSAYGKGTVFLPLDDGSSLPLQCPDPAAHPNGFVVGDTIRENTTYYLTGYQDAPPPAQQAKGPPIARASCDVTVQHPLPVISDFQATPAVWPFELGAVSVTLTWTVDWVETFGERSLAFSGPGGQSLSVDQTNTIVPNVSSPQAWTLRAMGSGGRSSHQEAAIKTQSVIDYLYHPPRKYKGAAIVTAGTTVPVHTTFELILSDLDHNTFNLTIDYKGLDQPIRNKQDFAAKLADGMFVIPGSGGNPENTLHFRITPGALILADPPSPGTFGIPATLYEEKF